MITIYNRQTKEFEHVKNSLGLRFLYNTIVGRIILKGATSKTISQISGKLLNSKISKVIIPQFIKKYQIDMNDYPQKKYQSFNDFFCREIIPQKRNVDSNKNHLVAPADSSLMVYPINNNCLLKVKNSIYTISELIQDKSLAKNYQNGYCLVFRLGVKDYHHYIFIDDGEIIANKKIKGIFHTVNPIAYKRYRVFKENNREWTLLKTRNFQEIIQIEVGALNVGKIINQNILKFNKGDEKGYFAFGASTVILLIKKDVVEIDQDIMNNSQKNIETMVKLGEKIGQKN